MNAPRFCPQSWQRSNRRGARADKACAHPFEILFRVDARRRRAASDADDDPMSVPKRTQLLQRLEALDRRRRERWEMAQKGNPVGVKAVVSVQGQTGRDSFLRPGKNNSPPRNPGPPEVKRVNAPVEHDPVYRLIECLSTNRDQVT